MSELKKPAKASDDESGELGESELDEIAGGVAPGDGVRHSSSDGSLLGWATFPNWQRPKDGKILSGE